ncbi:DUF342 domain-containing protein [Bacillus canaveralius]|uniref:DUF342 domain-containing protein n=1 Tax=Bacillus canaveralius TaxID=1403243 RepID=UPI000F79356E|nr:FapA family protein [Bacillus canaveralius]RSK47070.1 DUF342 domain-containing protein [Bacillus canaveralius]
MELYRDETILLEEESGSVFITVFKSGMTFVKLDRTLQALPQISITKFLPLKDALSAGYCEKLEIGEIKPPVDLEISRDSMTVKIRINCTEQHLKENLKSIKAEIRNMLEARGICEGILEHVIDHELKVQKDITVAAGTEAVDGQDAQLIYFQPSERKPSIKEDGKADFFDMHFLDEVDKGDWLGEKHDPTDGLPGRTIFGEILHPKKGKDRKLLYDAKTVMEYEEDGVIVLRALVKGVVEKKGNRIAVGDHLVVNGDVGLETGNIDFNGNITIKGIIMEGFSVTADKDISILGAMGLSGVESVTSRNGDIFIKGGAFGKGKTKIRAAKNIFIKHANECTLQAGENIMIAYYSVGCFLIAKNVLAHEKKGKLIGGVIEAKGKVVAGIVGNHLERKTMIHVEGFNRASIETELAGLVPEYDMATLHAERYAQQISSYESVLDQLNEQQKNQYALTKSNYEKELDKLNELDQKRTSLLSLLETKGEGEVTVGVTAYPETVIQIKSMIKRIHSTSHGTFYATGNILHHE